jgi:hypothetical protein
MITQAIGGWALLTSALLTLFILIGTSAAIGGNILYLVIGEVLSLLPLAGLLAIWTMQPHTGRFGQFGLWCLGLGAGLAFLVRLLLLLGISDVDTPALISTLFGLMGSLLVGWGRIRAKVCHRRSAGCSSLEAC